MDTSIILAAIGIVVAVVIGGWQIYLAQKQLRDAHPEVAQAIDLADDDKPAEKAEDLDKENQPESISPEETRASKDIDEHETKIESPSTDKHSQDMSLSASERETESREKASPVYKKRPSPAEVLAAIERVPPGQRKMFSLAYIGLPVEWQVSFRILHHRFDNADRVVLMFLDRQDRFGSWVACEVDLKDYPEFKIAEAGSRYWITGVISGVEFGAVNLEDVSIRPDESEINPNQPD